MAASASESQAQTDTNTVSTQGAAGAGSPTVVAEGNVNYNDPALAEDAIAAAGQEVLAALANNQSTTTAVAQNSAAQQSQQSELNQLLLQAESNQVSASTPVQPSVTATNDEQYIIVGGFALVGIVVLALLLKK
jgi:hypothetical protein